MTHPLTSLALALFAGVVQAQCVPPIDKSTLMPVFVVSNNAKGSWEGHWCRDENGKLYPYIAVATKASWSLVGSQRAVAAWLSKPTIDGLYFGSDPFADPALRAVWVPEYPKLLAIKPKS